MSLLLFFLSSSTPCHYACQVESLVTDFVQTEHLMDVLGHMEGSQLTGNAEALLCVSVGSLCNGIEFCYSFLCE